METNTNRAIIPLAPAVTTTQPTETILFDPPPCQPFKFQTPEELQAGITAYFAHCDKANEHYTMSGLAVYLGTNRATIKNYAAKDNFSEIITAARARVEAYNEQLLLNPNSRNATGVIFNLKNNFGWVDKTEVDNTHKIVSVKEMMRAVRPGLPDANPDPAD